MLKVARGHYQPTRTQLIVPLGLNCTTIRANDYRCPHFLVSRYMGSQFLMPSQCHPLTWSYCELLVLIILLVTIFEPEAALESGGKPTSALSHPLSRILNMCATSTAVEFESFKLVITEPSEPCAQCTTTAPDIVVLFPKQCKKLECLQWRQASIRGNFTLGSWYLAIRGPVLIT